MGRDAILLPEHTTKRMRSTLSARYWFRERSACRSHSTPKR